MLLKGGDYVAVADLLTSLAATRRHELAGHPRNCPCWHCHFRRKQEAAKATREKWERRRAGSAA